MAQWSHADRTLQVKLVYYGPAFGGKTTNLEALHRITDPQGSQRLLSVKTTGDRTLFFDLLPFDLGDILGYQVAVKLYTVPGQVCYDTTRQVVLSGADAIVFVADSSESRREQNVWSLQNLRRNMRSVGLDPQRVPLLFQFNKQDLPCAAKPEVVAGWLGVARGRGIPSVAVRGRGVVETFVAASRAMIEKLVAAADSRTRDSIDRERLAAQFEQAFAPHLERAAATTFDLGSSAAEPVAGEVPQGDELLQRSVLSGVELGEELVRESARAARLERESETYRELCEALRCVGASFAREDIVDAALETVARILESPLVTLVAADDDGAPQLEHAFGGPSEPLLSFESGRSVLRGALTSSGPTLVAELRSELPGASECADLAGLRGVAAVPVERGRRLLVYSRQPDGRLGPDEVRFARTVARHLAIGLDKARFHEELRDHRDRLERQVAERTEALQAACDRLSELDRVKARFLANMSHEMRTPLTAILSSGHALTGYHTTEDERQELAAGIVDSAQTLSAHLDDLFQLAHADRVPGSGETRSIGSLDLAQRAIELAGVRDVVLHVDQAPEVVDCDPEALARGVAQLIDNARKFSTVNSEVTLVLASGAEPGTLSIAVLDRGPGIADEERQRIFEPFEQGGDPLTEKPSGMGLGLHSAQAVALRHGGTLDYRPRPEGGSEFRLTVPLHEITSVSAEDSLV